MLMLVVWMTGVLFLAYSIYLCMNNKRLFTPLSERFFYMEYGIVTILLQMLNVLVNKVAADVTVYNHEVLLKLVLPIVCICTITFAVIMLIIHKVCSLLYIRFEALKPGLSFMEYAIMCICSAIFSMVCVYLMYL